MLRQWLWPSLIAVICLACGGGKSGTSISGTVGGQSINVKDQIAGGLTRTCSTSPGTIAAEFLVAFADVANVCATAQTNSGKANATILTLGIFRFGSNPPPIQPGTYTISDTTTRDSAGNFLGAGALFAKYDATCKQSFATAATSGTITISSISSSSATGSFDATFSTGRVSGTFDSPICGFPANVDVCASSTTPPACVP